MKGIPKETMLDALSKLMQDPRYFGGNHRGHGQYVDFMRAGFETALADGDDEKDERAAGDAGRPALPSGEQELVRGLQNMSPGDRSILVIEMLKREVARRHGIGPDGPVGVSRTSPSHERTTNFADRPSVDPRRFDKGVKRLDEESEKLDRLRESPKEPPTRRRGLPPMIPVGPGSRPNRIGGRRLLPSFMDILE